MRQCRLLNGIQDNNCEHSFALELGSNGANESSSSSARRKMLVGTLKVSVLAAMFVPQPALSGEVGARITKAVTTSDLGVSVRRSVVKGAQVIDSLDGKWEQFSDENGLGAARYKQQPRPKPKDIPDPLPLNKDVAQSVLKICDATFVEFMAGLSMQELQDRVEKVDSTVRKSFERSGLVIDDSKTITSPEVFNYFCYTHFKAFCEIIIERKAAFNRKNFERLLGQNLLSIFAPSSMIEEDLLEKGQGVMKSKDLLIQALKLGLNMTTEITNNLRFFGFVALVESIELDEEKFADWSDDLSDLQFSIPVDGDVTLSSQILLQEQGFRIYPDFTRILVTSAMERVLVASSQKVTSDEYYMDTGYSSNPDLFEVKQVLVNIVIDSA